MSSRIAYALKLVKGWIGLVCFISITALLSSNAHAQCIYLGPAVGWFCPPTEEQMAPSTPSSISFSGLSHSGNRDQDGSFAINLGSSTNLGQYEIWERLNSSSWTRVHNSSSPGVTRNVGNGTWQYRARACNPSSCSSYTSTISVDVIKTPGTPGGISGPSSDTNGAYSLSWGAASGSVSTYTLQRRLSGGSWSTIQNTSSRSRSESGRSNGTWQYRVRACNSLSCSGWTSTKSVQVLFTPGVPGSISASSLSHSGSSQDSNGAYSLSWGAASGSVSTYTLQERVNSGSYTTVQNTSARSRSFSGKGNATYSYRVRACNSLSCSAWTSVKSIGVIRAPGTPGSISGPSTDSDGSYSLSWGAASGVVNNYQLQEQVGGGSWSTIQNTGSRSRSISGKNNGSYGYRVRACNSLSCGGWTSIDTVMVTLPFSAPATSNGSHTVSWAAISGADSYKLFENGVLIYIGPGLSWSVSGRVSGTYSYSLEFCQDLGPAVGELCLSEGMPTLSVEVFSVPGKPSIGYVPSIDLLDGEFTINWNAPPSATSFDLQSKPIHSNEFSTIYSGSQTSRTFQNVTPQSIAYRVRACNDDFGCGEWSSERFVNIDDLENISSSPSITTNVVPGLQAHSVSVSSIGSASISVPLNLTKGIGGLQPSLSLAYSSSGLKELYESRRADGVLGYGWALSGISTIDRCSNGAPTASDSVLCLDGELLVKVGTGSYWNDGSEYRLESDRYIRVFAKGSHSNSTRWFEVHLPNGHVRKYGSTVDSRTAGVVASVSGYLAEGPIYKWGITEEKDDFGNLLTVDWFKAITLGSIYPTSINYANASIDFHYQVRNDTFTRSVLAQTSLSRVALNRIELSINNLKVREYRIAHEFIDNSLRLKQVQQCGYSENGGAEACLTPITANWMDIPGAPEGFESAVEYVDNGFGDRTYFTYAVIDGDDEDHVLNEPLHPWFGSYTKPSNVGAFPGSQRVLVSQLDRPNGLGGTNTSLYYYSGAPLYDMANRGFVGFAQTRVDQLDLPIYDPATDTTKTVDVISRRQHLLDIGLYDEIARTVTSISDAGVETEIRRKEYDWQKRANIQNTNKPSNFNYIAGLYLWNYELNSAGASTLSSVTRVDTEFCYVSLSGQSVCPESGDEEEHPTQSKTTSYFGESFSDYTEAPGSHWGSIGTRDVVNQLKHQEKTVVYENYIGANNWVIGFEKKTLDGFGRTTATEFDEAQSFKYDSASPAVGLSQLFPGDPDFEVTQNFNYDGVGNLTNSTTTGVGMLPRSVTSSGFALNNQLFPEIITNAEGHTTQFNYDFRFGVAKQVIDPNSQSVTSTYDNFGRVIQTIASDGTTSSIQYEDCLQVSCGFITWGQPRLRVTSNTSNNGKISPTTRRYIDSRGKELLVETEAFDSADGWLRQETHYDIYGRAYKTSLPYYSNTGTPVYTTVDFDYRSRVIQTNNADGTRLTTEFTALGNGLTQVINTMVQTGRQKITQFNAIDQLVKVTEAVGTAEQNQIVYAYNDRGNLLRVLINNNEVAYFTYDRAGNRDQIVEPDTGITIFEYDALGQLKITTDSNAQRTIFDYDKLGRLLERIEDVDGPNQTVATWTWDAATNGVGALHSVQNSIYTQIFSYDDLSRIDNTTTNINVAGFPGNGSFVTDVDYDSQGRANQVTYHNDVRVVSHFTSRGYASHITQGATVLEQNDEVNQFGQVVKQSFGNNLQIQRTVNPLNGRLESVQTGTVSLPKSIQDLEFQWREDGQLLQRKDLHGTSSTGDDLIEIFSYDNLNRIKSATVSTGGNHTRLQSYSYDSRGNLQYLTSDKSGDAAALGYSYPTASKPDRLNTVSINGINQTLEYDNNGNITRYNAASGDDTWITYDGANRVTELTVGVSKNTSSPAARDNFWYGPGGNRVVKLSEWDDQGSAQSAWTLYLGGIEIVFPDNSTGVDKVENIQLTATATLRTIYYIDGSTTAELEYNHKGLMGSSEVTTNANGVVKRSLSNDAFGARRKSDWSRTYNDIELEILIDELELEVSRGFTDHEHLDRTGFIHMNGRVYDPRIARFLSPDPVNSKPFHSQRYNKYAYVMNNPMMYTDPSGFDEDPRQVDRMFPPGHGREGGPEATNGVIEEIVVYGGAGGGGIGGEIALGTALLGGGGNAASLELFFELARDPSFAYETVEKAVGSSCTTSYVKGKCIRDAIRKIDKLGGKWSEFARTALEGARKNTKGLSPHEALHAKHVNDPTIGFTLGMVADAIDIHGSIQIPFVGGLEFGMVSFTYPLDFGFYLTGSTDIGGFATGRLAAGVSQTIGPRSNFDGTGVVSTFSLGEFGLTYGHPLGDSNSFPPESLSLDFGPQLGYSVQATQTFSFTARDLGRLMAWMLSGGENGGKIIGE